VSAEVRPGAHDAVVLDVSGLPEYAAGVRDPMWWGALWLVAIEATAMGILLVSALYVRGNFDTWPPSAVGRPALRLALIDLALLAASYAPLVAAVRAGRHQRLIVARRWLLIATALGVAMLVVRGFQIPRIPFRWDTNAYGSVFWMTFGLHITHVVTGVVENCVMLALFFIGPVEKKHFSDLEASALLWYFCVLEWLPAFALLYGPSLWGGG
jgi:heme/copper-type cytochrome/quinol oxidase subunit 3